MLRKGPHISISPEAVVDRILRISPHDFSIWAQSARLLAIELAEELFLVAYNPFIEAAMVRKSVDARFQDELFALPHHYATSISEGITQFWSVYEAEAKFKQLLLSKLQQIFSPDAIITSPGELIACTTDATDLRVELPLLVVEPDSAAQIVALVQMANELKFALIPVGGASGMTGGSVPIRKRTVIVRMTRLTNIQPVILSNQTVSLEAGVITQTAIDAVSKQGFLLTIDPASKAASSIGGNVAENSGGPFAFEYGTTLDNLVSWQMVTPTGELIEVERSNHPGRKILEQDVASFVLKKHDGQNFITFGRLELAGTEIRLPGLGKDVTNKALGGLPGVQKEGVDGFIVQATFKVHVKPAYSKVLVLEFFGSSMHEATLVIGKIVALRDEIRQGGDYARLSALEEFNAKYVQAIEYQKKSSKHQGLPISVIILQIDGDEPDKLELCVQDIIKIVQDKPGVALMIAADEHQAELYWEDRHKLSAIAKRTSGFKINEDVVLPMHKIPDFALYLEQQNLCCVRQAYVEALKKLSMLPETQFKTDLSTELTWVETLPATPDLSQQQELTDDALLQRGTKFLTALAITYPDLSEQILKSRDYMLDNRVLIASHMHAGDGNCHVNIPVNSNNLEMLHLAESVADQIMNMAKAMGGAVSGEHGIGITKIAFLDPEKMEDLRAFKALVDPRDVCNPGKLTQATLPVRPFTFSFNRLIKDLQLSDLPEKERLVQLLSTVQNCTRCGKCKQVCPMLYPKRGMHYYPRNKNLMLGALIEALSYAQIIQGKPGQETLAELRRIMEHCTGCGRCSAVCPVKIHSAEVTLELRAFLEHEGAGGHPIKNRVLSWLIQKPGLRVPKAAKAAALGQHVQNRMLSLLPQLVRKRVFNPLFASKGPTLGYRNIYDSLKLAQGGIFIPQIAGKPIDGPAVLYFPGCGGSLFSRTIGLSTLALLLAHGITVVMPQVHLCCGYPLLVSGISDAFGENLQYNRKIITATFEAAAKAGVQVSKIITACGSCRTGLERHSFNSASELPKGLFMDVVQFISQSGEKRITPDFSALDNVTKITPSNFNAPNVPNALNVPNAPNVLNDVKPVIYHASCHTEWAEAHKINGAKMQVKALAQLSQTKVYLNPGCCGESGMGALTSPLVFNAIRERKMSFLQSDLQNYPDAPLIVGCPSCKVGISRSLINLKSQRPVLHTGEWLAEMYYKPLWGKNWLAKFVKQIAKPDSLGRRTVEISGS